MLTQRKVTLTMKAAIATSLALVLLAGCNLPIAPAATPTPSPTPIAVLPQDTSTPIPPTAEPTVEPTAAATSTPSAVSIAFSTGATAGVETGTIQPNQVQAYTLSAQESQPMILILASTHNDVYLGVLNPDGSVLLDPAKKWTNWQWLLPKTGMYTIQVFGGATSEDYTLTAKVAARVKFAAGASSVTLNGSTPNGYVISYALACKANQTMTVSLNLPASSAYIDIFGLASGTILSPASKATSWTGTLPATEDYIIEVIPNNGQVVNYSLTVTVQ